MRNAKPIRVGLMGFGQTGRQIYELASHCEDIEIVAIADIGEPSILHYLLQSEAKNPEQYQLDKNFICNPRFRARLLSAGRPSEMPWDMFEVDVVVDATGIYREAAHMQAHLDNGAPRVVLRSLPIDAIDRIVIPGVNEAEARSADQMISAGSATTSALCLLLKILSDQFEIEFASMTSIHSYTGDQALQDYASSDFRRSRSAAKNIIPNTHEAHLWLKDLLPTLAGKVLTYALNVPIHDGCLLDVNLVMKDEAVTAQQVNDAMRTATASYSGIVGVAEDPIVSSDVIGSSLSLLFDTHGTTKAGASTIKTLSWYEKLGHSARILDVIRLFQQMDAKQEAA